MILVLRVTPSPAARCLAALEPRFGAVSRWTRLFSAGAAALVLSAAATADAPAALPKPAPPAVPRADLRASRLGKFFRSYHCPEPHHISDYLRAADGYGLDYRLLPAISVRETQCGVTEAQNNWWGYHPGRQSFPTVAEGIDYVARQLAENPLYKNKTLRDKLFTYNPRPAYPVEVEWIMRRIE